MNSLVVRNDVSVLAEGKHSVSAASKTQTVSTAVTITELNVVDTGSRHTGMAANVALSAFTRSCLSKVTTRIVV